MSLLASQWGYLGLRVGGWTVGGCMCIIECRYALHGRSWMQCQMCMICYHHAIIHGISSYQFLMFGVATITHLGEVVVRYQGALPMAKHLKLWGHQLAIASCVIVHAAGATAAFAKASAAPPEMSPANDSRPQHWVEVAKSGDCWMLCKDGGWVAGIGACHVMGWPT